LNRSTSPISKSFCLSFFQAEQLQKKYSLIFDNIGSRLAEIEMVKKEKWKPVRISYKVDLLGVDRTLSTELWDGKETYLLCFAPDHAMAAARPAKKPNPKYFSYIFDTNHGLLEIPMNSKALWEAIVEIASLYVKTGIEKMHTIWRVEKGQPTYGTHDKAKTLPQ
jgi:hypothetical protein